MSWIDKEAALRYVREIVAGDYDDTVYSRVEIEECIETPEQHGACWACA